MIRFSFLSPWYRLAKDHILLHRVSEGVGESELKDTEIICHFGGNRKFLERETEESPAKVGFRLTGSLLIILIVNSGGNLFSRPS